MRARPKGANVALDGRENLLHGRDTQLEAGLAINGLLEEMENKHPDWVSIIEMKFFEMKFFAGFTDGEVAGAIGLPLRSMQRRFGDTRRWR
jgi:hypothetical protein